MPKPTVAKPSVQAAPDAATVGAESVFQSDSQPALKGGITDKQKAKLEKLGYTGEMPSGEGSKQKASELIEALGKQSLVRLAGLGVKPEKDNAYGSDLTLGDSRYLTDHHKEIQSLSAGKGFKTSPGIDHFLKTGDPVRITAREAGVIKESLAKRQAAPTMAFLKQNAAFLETLMEAGVVYPAGELVNAIETGKFEQGRNDRRDGDKIENGEKLKAVIEKYQKDPNLLAGLQGGPGKSLLSEQEAKDVEGFVNVVKRVLGGTGSEQLKSAGTEALSQVTAFVSACGLVNGPEAEILANGFVWDAKSKSYERTRYVDADEENQAKHEESISIDEEGMHLGYTYWSAYNDDGFPDDGGACDYVFKNNVKAALKWFNADGNSTWEA